jgi:hypothetical protein
MNEQIEKQAIEEMALTLSEGGCGKECDCIQGDKFNCHLLYSASVLYNAGYRKQEWISVDERLPEIYQDVLWSDGRSIGMDFRTFDGKWCDGDCHEPTHWQPLPEPPKMKGGAE